MRRTEPTPPSRPEDDNDTVVEEFLDGQPRADTWRELKETLLARYKDAVAVRDAMDPDDPALPAQEKRVREMRDQVAVLAEEEAVTQFVEDSVRASLARPAAPRSAEDVDDGEGYY